MLKLGRRLACALVAAAAFRGARLRANHAQGRAAFRSQDHRSDLDHGADLHPSRQHGLRHAVRPRRKARGQAADGRQVGGLARQAHLDLHPARRAGMARRQAGDGRGLRRLDQALGRQGFDGPEADGRRDRALGARRQDHQDGAEAALRAGARIARQVELQRALHDAQGGRRAPIPTARSPTPPARAPSSSRRTSGSRARRRSTSRTRNTSRAPSPRPAWPAARSPRSTGSNGSGSPTPRPRSMR